MSKFLFILIAIINGINPGFSQNEQQPVSHIQSFMEQTGKYVKNNFIDIGKVNDITVQMIKSGNLTDNKTLNGVRLSYKKTNTAETQYGYLDVDEIHELTRTMSDLKTNIFSNPPATTSANNLEYYYTCRSGLKVGGFSAFFAGTYGSMTWNGYVILDAMKPDKIIISIDDFDRLRVMLLQAKADLEPK